MDKGSWIFKTSCKVIIIGMLDEAWFAEFFHSQRKNSSIGFVQPFFQSVLGGGVSGPKLLTENECNPIGMNIRITILIHS